MLTAGQAHDLTCAEPLLEGVEAGALLGDKAFDADRFIETLERREITPVITHQGQPQGAARLRFWSTASAT